MIYTPLTKTALRIAFGAHKDQVDKTGLPYVFHPFHLAEQMETEEEVIVALLHDVTEDSNMTLDDLRTHGFPDCVIEAIALLTHDDSVEYEYMDYIAKIKSNPLATKIKLADLRHNSDVTRLDVIDDKMKKRHEKYKAAIRLLMDETDGILFFADYSRELLIATRPKPGSAILFIPKEQKWDYSPRNYFQLTSMCGYDSRGFETITPEEAKEIYKNIAPDKKLLDKIDRRMSPKSRDE